MSSTIDERAAVIVVRVWLERDGQARARITASDDLSSDERTVGAATGVDGILTAVREWLERFVGRSPDLC